MILLARPSGSVKMSARFFRHHPFISRGCPPVCIGSLCLDIPLCVFAQSKDPCSQPGSLGFFCPNAAFIAFSFLAFWRARSALLSVQQSPLLRDFCSLLPGRTDSGERPFSLCRVLCILFFFSSPGFRLRSFRSLQKMVFGAGIGWLRLRTGCCRSELLKFSFHAALALFLS